MSNRGFSSLENIKISFNKFICSNEDALPLKYISKLITDLAQLFNESNFYDIEIRVGEDDDFKTFKAHSTILKARSPYFKIALSDNWIKKSKDGIILFEKKNISPKVFEVILTYIYNGIININNLDVYGILELLEASDELDFNELIEDLQYYLIIEKKDWIQENLIQANNIASRHQSFNLFQDYCGELISKNPELYLKPANIPAIEKSMLISILKRDDLELDEIQIWDYVIKWGLGQIEYFDNKKISDLTKSDLIELKNVLYDIIPSIRFYEITLFDFWDKINPYKEIIVKEIYEEALQHYLNGKLQPSLMIQKGSRKPKRKLINLQIKLLISSWIDKTNEQYNNEINSSYDFQLILRGSWDGFSRSVFDNKCFNIKQTVIIMKIKETGELVGGYNPVCWNIKGRLPHEYYRIKTNKSFIFNIDENQTSDSIISRVKDPDCAIIHYCEKFDFTTADNINFNEKCIDFYDIALYNSINNEPYCYYFHWNTYEDNLSLMNYKKSVHLLEEYEVYKLVKKN